MKATQTNIEENERDTKRGDTEQGNNCLTSKEKMRNAYLKEGLRLSHGGGSHMKKV